MEVARGGRLIRRRRSCAAVVDGYRNHLRKLAISRVTTRPAQQARPVAGLDYAGAAGGLPALRSCETAVTSWAGANGLGTMTLLGTPLEGHSAALPPLM